MSAINVTQMSKPVRGGIGYMATCSECNKRNRLSQHLAKFYVSPKAQGWVWVMICQCGETCVVDVSAQQSVQRTADHAHVFVNDVCECGATWQQVYEQIRRR